MGLRNFLLSVTAIILVSSNAFAERLILESSDLKALAAAAKANGLQVIRELESTSALVVELNDHSKLKSLKSKIHDLKHSNDTVLSIRPLRISQKGRTVTQPLQSTPWGITAIKATEANSYNRGAGVKVCIVDTGIDKTHPDLEANLAGGRNFVVIKGKIDPTKWNDDNGHGSHVAGSVAALDNSIGVIGVAPDAKLYAVKVLNSRGSGYLSDVADGVTDCVRSGSQVVSMSLGADGDPSQPSVLKTAVQDAIAAGVVVIAAAGNEGEDISGKIPAGYDGVVAVAAVDQNMNFPTWSNFGLSADDFTAPGVSIYSTWKSGGYNTISGTSMAAPHVSGVIALKISSGSLGVKATNLNRSVSTQGAGLVDALGTVTNQP